MPRAQMLVDGKAIDFSWDKNSSVFVEYLSEPEPCLIVFLFWFGSTLFVLRGKSWAD
jgi:hypothetical protein